MKKRNSKLLDLALDISNAKTHLPGITAYYRSVLAGMYIGLGCIFMILIKSEDSFPPVVSSLLSGLVFSIGLLSVMTASGELFTGNCMIFTTVCTTSEVVDDLIIRGRFRRIFKTLKINYFGNLFGAMTMTTIIRGLHMDLVTAEVIAASKFSKEPIELIFSGIACNLLVCLAVIINYSSKSIVDTLIAVIFPITMFVACGFEHSVADMFFMCFVNDAIIPVPMIIFKLLCISFGNLIGGIVIASSFSLANEVGE